MDPQSLIDRLDAKIHTQRDRPSQIRRANQPMTAAR
jgi:hypothetical protein